jgi:hypothetical protein
MRNLNMRDQRFPPVENPAFAMTARWSVFENIKCDRTGETQSQSATVRDRRHRKNRFNGTILCAELIPRR